MSINQPLLPTGKKRRLFHALMLFLFVSIPLRAGLSNEVNQPFAVSHSITISNGNWFPLPVEDMRRAAGDSALSRLTDAGQLQLLSPRSASVSERSQGFLALEVALIGPAETVKLTIRLDLQGSPTLISTASISVRSLDHAGIFLALEHVGERAADRLVAKLDNLSQASIPNFSPTTESTTQRTQQTIDSSRRRLYDEAQSQKRAARYAEARASFEAVIAGAVNITDTLRQLSEDELRYGLPVFEAQQSLILLGRLSMPGQQANRDVALTRAENLYRQIQAENTDSVPRVTEAQQALDRLILTRSALANAERANLISQFYGLRLAMMESVMMEGECPDRIRVERLIQVTRVRADLRRVDSEGDGAKRYSFASSNKRNSLTLLCRNEQIDFIESVTGENPAPASHR